MRELTLSEMALVAGAGDDNGTGGGCGEGSGNNYGGITEPSSLGEELIEIYEGLVEATSYIIERVANAL